MFLNLKTWKDSSRYFCHSFYASEIKRTNTSNSVWKELIFSTKQCVLFVDWWVLISFSGCNTKNQVFSSFATKLKHDEAPGRPVGQWKRCETISREMCEEFICLAQMNWSPNQWTSCIKNPNNCYNLYLQPAFILNNKKRKQDDQLGQRSCCSLPVVEHTTTRRLLTATRLAVWPQSSAFRTLAVEAANGVATVALTATFILFTFVNVWNASIQSLTDRMDRNVSKPFYYCPSVLFCSLTFQNHW